MLTPLQLYLLIWFVIQKLDRDVKSIVLKFRSDQTINLRIINEKQGSAAGWILSTFRNFGRKPKNIQKNSEEWILIKLQYVVYQWISLNELYKLMKSFFKFKIIFWNFGRKLKNIWMNREVWILMKVKCIMYQWIWLDKLYKLTWTFF